jgi:hypothetical protein
MKTYVLTTPKDAHGQPLRMFKINFENNVRKARRTSGEQAIAHLGVFQKAL